jgi:hypothetical protein
MITIFNGRKRSLGDGSGPQSEVFAQMSVQFRSHLHHFKGAKLAVFLAIALHADQDGWAYPSRELLCKETGYNLTTVALALSELCEESIEGHRVLLRGQPRMAKGGTFANNTYLIFPSADEVRKFEQQPQMVRHVRKEIAVEPEPDLQDQNPAEQSHRRISKMHTRSKARRVCISRLRRDRVRRMHPKVEPSANENHLEGEPSSSAPRPGEKSAAPGTDADDAALAVRAAEIRAELTRPEVGIDPGVKCEQIVERLKVRTDALCIIRKVSGVVRERARRMHIPNPAGLTIQQLLTYDLNGPPVSDAGIASAVDAERRAAEVSKVAERRGKRTWRREQVPEAAGVDSEASRAQGRDQRGSCRDKRAHTQCMLEASLEKLEQARKTNHSKGIDYFTAQVNHYRAQLQGR